MASSRDALLSAAATRPVVAKAGVMPVLPESSRAEPPRRNKRCITSETRRDQRSSHWKKVWPVSLKSVFRSVRAEIASGF
jgi:hypothetical protein